MSKMLSADHQILGQEVTTLADSDEHVVDARGMAYLSILTDADATATVSRVNADDADEDSAAAAANYTVAPDTLSTIPVDWPFYRVTSADGVTRVGLV